MKKLATCPACGQTCIDVCEYDSMMVLREDVALFTVKCPACSTYVSNVSKIPLQLKDEVRCAALELGAGMCQDK